MTPFRGTPNHDRRARSVAGPGGPGSPRFMGGFIPNFVIAGAPKCATSSLHGWLAAHPDAIGSFEKETYLLVDPGTHMFRATNTVRDGLAGYTRHFPPDTGQDPLVVIESTPSYLYSATALDVLPSMPSCPHVVFVLREPSAQIHSLFQYFQSNWNWIGQDVSFQQFVDRARAGDPPDYGGNELARNALENARYVQFLRRWREAFGEARMRVFLFERLRHDPGAVTREVAGFAGLDTRFFDDFVFPASNRTVAVRWHRLQAVNIAVRGLLPKGRVYNRARSLYRRLNTTAPASVTKADAATLAELKRSFEEDNARLAAEFGLDLSPWA